MQVGTTAYAASPNFRSADLFTQALLEGAIAAARRREARARVAQAVQPPRLPPLRRQLHSGPLRICYLMPRTDVGGGARVLIEHASRLSGEGHLITVLSHGPKPHWTHLNAAFVQVPLGVRLADAIPRSDVIVAGYWEQVLEARSTGLAPVVHFEQGDFHLFETLSPQLHDIVTANLKAADRTITVGEQTAKVLHDRYGVYADVFHNAVDLDVFFPAQSLEPKPSQRYVLVVGWDGDEFKGIADARRAWDLLRREDPELQLVWVSPRPPKDPVGTVVVSPSQPVLADLYRQASVYVCASRYESFGLPPLEAMACGTPVVTTSNVGVLEYARDGENAVVVAVNDPKGLAKGIRLVLRNSSVRERCRRGGLATAKRFSWERTIDRLSCYYSDLADFTVEKASLRDQWEIDETASLNLAPDEMDHLLAALERSDASEIQLPVIEDVGAGQLEAEWATVAKRRSRDRHSARLWLPLLASRASCNVRHDPLSASKRLILSGKPGEALNMLQTQDGGPERSADVVRWTILALIGSGRLEEAEVVVRDALETWPDHPDFWRLGAAVRGSRLSSAERTLLGAALELLGPGAWFSQWFVTATDLALGETRPAQHGKDDKGGGSIN